MPERPIDAQQLDKTIADSEAKLSLPGAIDETQRTIDNAVFSGEQKSITDPTELAELRKKVDIIKVCRGKNPEFDRVLTEIDEIDEFNAEDHHDIQ